MRATVLTYARSYVHSAAFDCHNAAASELAMLGDARAAREEYAAALVFGGPRLAK